MGTPNEAFFSLFRQYVGDLFIHMAGVVKLISCVSPRMLYFYVLRLFGGRAFVRR